MNVATTSIRWRQAANDRFGGFLIALAILIALFVTPEAIAQERMAPPCSPGMLDASLMMPDEIAGESKAHWLAVVIRNRSQSTCVLASAEIKFPPDDQNRWSKDSSDAARAFEQRHSQLGAGETAHVLVAWSSVPQQVRGLPLQDCTSHDRMTFAAGALPDSGKPLLEVQHLWIQSCGPFWTSQYRPGMYVHDEPVAEDWLQRFQLQLSDFPQPFSREVQDSKQLRLRALNEVEYLKGSFESGYSGYFELFLKSSSPAASNCPFSTLRKREADGQTVVYVAHCESLQSHVPPESSAPEIRLPIRELDLLPQRRGQVEYEVVSELLAGDKRVLADARAEISVRDPKDPTLPAIDSATPGCQATQVKLNPQAAELGSHWREARAHATRGQQWHDGKVFEVTNISGQSCVLGGVPDLKFLNLPEITTGWLRPPVCRNCANPLFKPREGRWIELKPGDAAHFMVARTVLDPDHWFMCTVIGGLELTLPGDKQPLRLPFEAGSCGAVTVTAWRASRYDADPMNIQYDEREKQREQRRLAAAQPLSKECAEVVSPDTGRPVMFPSEGPVIWGLSSKPSPYGSGTPVLLWLLNASDKPQGVMTCSSIDWFWQYGVDVFDSAGQRVLRRVNEQSSKGAQFNFVCTRNFAIEIPPHSCMHTTFTERAYDLSRDLQRYYMLPPGRYFAVPAKRDQNDKPVTRMVTDPADALAVTVLEE